MKLVYNNEKLIDKMRFLRGISKFLTGLVLTMCAGVVIYVGYVLLTPASLIVLIPTGSYVIMNLLLQFGSWADKKADEHCQRFCHYLVNDCDLDINSGMIKGLDIIPKNVKIGENLEASNAIPIFKDGKYIIVHNEKAPIILQEYKRDTGDVVVEFLEENEVREMERRLTPKELKLVYRQPKKIEGELNDKD